MPAVVRQGDISTGHGAFPPTTEAGGSNNVFINGKAAVRVGDAWNQHCDPTPVCHTGTSSNGSTTVFVNGKSICRVGDSISCGDSMAAGSPNVFAN